MTTSPLHSPPVITKCFAILAVAHLRSSLPSKIDCHQFAYCPNMLTGDSISSGLHSALIHLDNKNSCVRMLFVEFNIVKFNIVIPSNLVTKLSNLYISTSLCNWTVDFLTNNHTSSTLLLNTGVLQGYVLGPLLCSLFTP